MKDIAKEEDDEENNAQKVQDFALQAPDADVQQQPNAPQDGAQALQPPDPDVINPAEAGQHEVQNQIQAAPVGNPAVGAAAGVQQQKDAVVNNIDNNNNGADVADIPVHRGVKVDPAIAIENGESHQGEENQADPNQDAAANADVGAL